MLKDPMDTLPLYLRQEIELIWARKVKGGRKRFDETDDRCGTDGQREISGLLKKEGIKPNWDGRYEAIRDYGQSLYYDKMPPAPITGPIIKKTWQVGAGANEESDRPEE